MVPIDNLESLLKNHKGKAAAHSRLLPYHYTLEFETDSHKADPPRNQIAVIIPPPATAYIHPRGSWNPIIILQITNIIYNKLFPHLFMNHVKNFDFHASNCYKIPLSTNEML